jgi:DNA mismatch endonuclease (patch repair protein)
MVDIVDTATRSRMMAGIKGKNTKPEKLVRSLLHRQGFRFRLNVRELPGKPDIVLPRYHAVIFVNGCFWHGHDCVRFKWPKTRTDFWQHKIEGNRSNDQKVIQALLSKGWRVSTIWECALRGNSMTIEAVVNSMEEWLKSDRLFLEIRGLK